jgi:hypothetical protein
MSRNAYFGSVHLVHGNDELPHTKRECKEGVLSCLTILGDTGLELTRATGNDEDSTVSLRGTRNHVLDEITMARSIDDLPHNQIEQAASVRSSTYSDNEFRGLELPKSDINGDTTLTLGLQLVEHPCC